MHEKTTKETALWRAVILQAILDRLTQSKRGEDIKARKDAKKWMNVNNNEFLVVCNLARLNPEDVIQKTEKAIFNQEKWRRKCDIGKGVQFN